MKSSFLRIKWLVPRLWHLITGWGTVGLVYKLTGHFQSPAIFVIPETPLDRLMEFNPIGVWIYLSFFALIPSAYLFCDMQRLRWLSRSMQLCALICGAVYLLWPTTLIYPPVEGPSLSAVALRWLIRIDSTQNCLPSLHGALSFLAIQSLLPNAFFRRTLLWCWGVAIACAVLQTRRHLLLDFGAGVAVGWISGSCMRPWATNLMFVASMNTDIDQRRTAS